MAQTILGIDLGSYSVKIVQIERGFGEFKIVNFFELPLVAEEVLTYEQAASAALTRFFEEHSIVYDSCVLSLPGRMVSARVLELPFTQAKKIDQTLEYELETLVPFDIEDILFDYQILSVGESTSNVLVTYVREEDFKRILHQVQSNGVDPRYMGINTMDLANLSHLGVLPPESSYAILDLGHSQTNMVVLEGTQLKGVRCFSWGGNDLNQAIAQSGQMSLEEAEDFKLEKGQVVEKSDDPRLQAVKESVDLLLQQIRQTLFSFYDSGKKPIEALYLSGGTSRLNGLDSYLSHRLKFNVSPLDVLEEAFSDLSNPDQVRPLISTALASALRAVFPNKTIKINFRRGIHGYKKDIEQLGGTLKRIGALAVSAAVLGLIYFIISYVNLSGQVGKMNKSVTQLMKTSVTGLPKKGVKSTKSALSILTGKISELDEKLKKVQWDKQRSGLEILKMISEAMPPREQLVVDIDDVSITTDRVRLEGRTGSYEGVDKVKTSMEKVKDFKNVQTGNVRKGVREQIKFTLSFDLAG